MKKVVYKGMAMKRHFKRLAYKTGYEMKRTRWVFHLTDDDDFPSVPHGHSLNDNRLKLDVNTGKIYNSNTGKSVDSIKESDLKKLWRDTAFLHFQKRAKEYYETHHKEKSKVIQKRGYNNIRYAVKVQAMHRPQLGVIGYARRKTYPEIIKDEVFIFEIEEIIQMEKRSVAKNSKMHVMA